MHVDEFVCLMYHELQVPGRPTCRSGRDYMRYVVPATAFAEQIKYLRNTGWWGCSVTEALGARRPVVVLTFDDGAATDVEVAAPLICDAGFTATFYVVASWVGARGCLNAADLRRLVGLGLEIGSHSLTHTYLPRVGVHELRRELQESKQQLEDWIGAPVLHFSCPLGGYSSAVMAGAAEAGYATVATSQVGTNHPAAKVLNRVPVRRATSLAAFGRTCMGKLLYPRVRQFLLSGLRSVIGYPAVAALGRLAPYRTNRL